MKIEQIILATIVLGVTSISKVGANINTPNVVDDTDNRTKTVLDYQPKLISMPITLGNFNKDFNKEQRGGILIEGEWYIFNVKPTRHQDVS